MLRWPQGPAPDGYAWFAHPPGQCEGLPHASPRPRSSCACTSTLHASPVCNRFALAHRHRLSPVSHRRSPATAQGNHRPARRVGAHGWPSRDAGTPPPNGTPCAKADAPVAQRTWRRRHQQQALPSSGIGIDWVQRRDYSTRRWQGTAVSRPTGWTPGRWAAAGFLDWCTEHRVARHDSQQGQPAQHASRPEMRNAHRGDSLAARRVKSDTGLRHSNEEQPHNRLGPVPRLTFLPRPTPARRSRCTVSTCRGR